MSEREPNHINQENFDRERLSNEESAEVPLGDTGNNINPYERRRQSVISNHREEVINNPPNFIPGHNVRENVNTNREILNSIVELRDFEIPSEQNDLPVPMDTVETEKNKFNKEKVIPERAVFAYQELQKRRLEQELEFVKRLTDAGISEEVVDYFTFGGPYRLTDEYTWLDQFTDGGLKAIAKIAPNKHAQKLVLGYFKREPEDPQIIAEITEKVNDLGENPEESEKQLEELGKFMSMDEQLPRILHERSKERRFTGAILMLKDNNLKNLFAGDLTELNKFFNDLENRKYRSWDMETWNSISNLISKSSSADLLLKGLTYKEVIKLEPMTWWYLKDMNPEASQIFNKYANSPQNWADSITWFKDAVRLSGVEVPDGIEKNKALLDRIRRRENANHPLVTLGLVTTVGMETEYPMDTSVVSRIDTRNLLLMDSIGFRRGTGVPGLHSEASPGPFYDPITAATVSRLYYDAKIINPDENLGMNTHFNVGELAYTVENRTRLTRLVRSLYLTGAAYDPYSTLTRAYLHIEQNGNHWEAKVFDVTTQADQEWNLMSASYLTWALKAQAEAGEDKPGGELRRELSSYWEEYQNNMEEGLSFVGRKDLLTLLKNTTETDIHPDIQWLDGQLKKLWKDDQYYEIPVLKNVGQLNPEVPDENGVQGIMFKGEWFPNVAIFARTITDRTVSKISALANRLEQECVNDISKVDNTVGKTDRRHAIRDFVKKYNLKLENPKSRRQQEKAYQSVRSLFVKEVAKHD